MCSLEKITFHLGFVKRISNGKLSYKLDSTLFNEKCKSKMVECNIQPSLEFAAWLSF